MELSISKFFVLKNNYQKSHKSTLYLQDTYDKLSNVASPSYKSVSLIFSYSLYSLEICECNKYIPWQYSPLCYPIIYSMDFFNFQSFIYVEVRICQFFNSFSRSLPISSGLSLRPKLCLCISTHSNLASN